MLPLFHVEGGQQGQEHWENTAGPPSRPNCCPHPHRPLPAPPCAHHLPLLLLLLFPHYQGTFFQHGQSPHSPKMHLEGLKGQEKPQVSQGGCKSPVPPALPLAPRCPGAEAALTLILCRRRLGSRRLAAVRSQVLLGVHKNQHLGGGGGELRVPAISAGGAGERGGEGFHRGDDQNQLRSLDGAEHRPDARAGVELVGRIRVTSSPVSGAGSRPGEGLCRDSGGAAAFPHLQRSTAVGLPEKSHRDLSRRK
nr:uncharacterized protein LOC110355552 isoform X1 [Columba livia]